MGKTDEPIQAKLDRFLLTYRVTPTHMGKSPSELLMNRQPRTKFNSLRFAETKEQVKVFQENMNHTPKFENNDAVFAKNFGRGANWVPGTIIDILSPKSFLIQVKDVVWKRHVDQLKPRIIPDETSLYDDGKEKVLMQSHCDEISKRMFQQQLIEKRSAEQQTDEFPQTTDLKSAQVENTSGNIQFDDRNNVCVSTIERRTSGRRRRPTKRFITEDE